MSTDKKLKLEQETIDRILGLPDSDVVVNFVDEYDVSGITTDDLKSLANNFQQVTSERDKYKAALDEIKRYIDGHDEPGHECAQCLAEGIIETALQQGEQTNA